MNEAHDAFQKFLSEFKGGPVIDLVMKSHLLDAFEAGTHFGVNQLREAIKQQPLGKSEVQK